MRGTRKLCFAAAMCFAFLAVDSHSQAEDRATSFVGDWLYRLGPKVLFGLHLEVSSGIDDHVHGYILFPQKFYMNPGPFFSGIKNGERRELVASTTCNDGQLRLKEDNPSAKPEYLDTFDVRVIDARHLSVTLFPKMPPILMERARETVELARDWDTEHTYSPDDFVPDDSRMAAIVEADQSDRRVDNIDWGKVGKADEERRALTARLLRDGELHTGTDFGNAALVFQHGLQPDDYLLAHILTVVAISKGDKSALWLSAATLDRYLESVKQPQVLGTQFSTPRGKPTTQEPYNRTLISDVLRTYTSVPTQAEQEKQRKQYDAERGIANGAK